MPLYLPPIKRPKRKRDIKIDVPDTLIEVGVVLLGMAILLALIFLATKQGTSS